VSVIRVLAAGAVKGPLSAIIPDFERASGHRVEVEYMTAGQIDARLSAGDSAAVTINTKSRIAELAKRSGGIARDLGEVRIGIAVAPGVPRPDLSDVDTLRASLIAARSIAYTDPAAGGTVGAHFAHVIDSLGLGDELADKRVLAADGLDVMRRLVAGEVELGVTQTSEILAIAPQTFAGTLPEAVQLVTTYTAWMRNGDDEASRMLIEALTGDAGRMRLRAAGFT
jgi:molybdate transport system substrate-binding protein